MRKTVVEIQAPKFCINHDNSVLFMGSCFAENLTTHFENTGFHIAKDPNGVVFNPISIAKNLTNILADDIDKNAILQQDTIFLSYDSNSKVYALSETDFLANQFAANKHFKEILQPDSTLFITFGTAILYAHKEHGIVANCHKQPASLFQKRMATKDEIVDAWSSLIKELKKHNINVVFTVSPVRHGKEGLSQNSLSKSILLQAVHELCDKYDTYYFPAYEVVLDELRDYAYFNEDGVHPNEIAIKHVWNRVQATFFNAHSAAIVNEFGSLKSLFSHKPIHPESERTKSFYQKRNEKLVKFKERFPRLNYSIFGNDLQSNLPSD
jgi:regulator of sigma D